MTQEELAKYSESLEGKTLVELEKLEADVIEEADKVNKDIAEMEFDLPKENFKEVGSAVQYFLNKQEVQWQYTLGMVAMYDFWNKYTKKIPYPQLDAILRTLGSMKFTGYDEWARVIVINKYFEPLQKAYRDASEAAWDVASKHEAIMRKMDELNTQTDED